MATTIARCLLPFLILVAPWPAGMASRGDGRSPGEPSADPLVELNKSFREAYGHCRQSIVSGSGPIVLLEGDDLVLLHNGKRTQAKVIPEIYHTLKVISHVPLAIYVMLVNETKQPLDNRCLTELRSYRDKVVKAESALEKWGLAREALARQQEIIQTSLTFLDSVLSRKQLDSGDLVKFASGLKSQILANMAEAAQAELLGLDTQMQKWRATLTPDEWKKLRVVIMGSALPRQGNLATQYFAKLLDHQGEGERIIYAESIFDEARALNLLGTHLLDRSIGTAFFCDPDRMHRDLLSDAAKELLLKMKLDR
jgi:hypothetical protein